MVKEFKLGRFGKYVGNAYDDGSKAIFVSVNREPIPLENMTSGAVVITADDIAPFVTELIEMARVLGVTGEKKGND